MKALLPNCSFDMQTENAVGGSIIEQYKVECKHAENARKQSDANSAKAVQFDQTTSATATTFAASSSKSEDSLPGSDVMHEENQIPHNSRDHSNTTRHSVDTYENVRPVWNGQRI